MKKLLMVEVPAIKKAGEKQMSSSTQTLTLNCKWSGIEIDIDDVFMASASRFTYSCCVYSLMRAMG